MVGCLESLKVLTRPQGQEAARVPTLVPGAGTRHSWREPQGRVGSQQEGCVQASVNLQDGCLGTWGGAERSEQEEEAAIIPDFSWKGPSL